MNNSISVSDAIPRTAALRVRREPASRRQRTLVRGAGLVAFLDSLAAVAAIGLVLVSVNLHAMDRGLESFLSARITVKNLLLLIFLATAWPMMFRLLGLYEARRVHHLRSEAGRLLAAVTVGCGMALLIPLMSVSGSVTIWDLRHFWLVSLGLCMLVRIGRRAVDRAHHPHIRRTLIVGTGRLARQVYREIKARPHGYEVVGFLDEPSNGHGAVEFERVPEATIGTLDELEQILMQQVIDDVILALPVKSRYHQIQQAIGVCERAGVQAKYGADLFESTVAFPRYDAEGDRAFVAMQVVPDGYRLLIKRAIDIAGAVAGFIVLAPVLVVAALAIKVTSRGPVIYAQDRCGFGKRPFRMYKFRSMFVDADKLQATLESRNEARGPVFKIRNDPRITPLGRFLRKSSIDELPQLWNVLRGDMSLVGPRPLAWRDVNRIERPSHMRRFSMPPGITCLWQVQGRSNLDFDRWVGLDLEYIDRWSLALDLRILVETIPAVLSGNGAS